MDKPVQVGGVSRRRFVEGAGSLAGAMALGGLPAPAQAATGYWYSASGPKLAQDWVDLFHARTGRSIEFFRIGSNKLTQRIQQEIGAHQVKASVMDFGVPGLMRNWVKKGWIMRYDSPEARHYPADLRVDGYWTPISVLTVAIAYNADQIKPEEAPKTWEDLLDQKWKGRMVASDAQSSGAVLHAFNALQKAFGKSYIEKLAKQEMLIKIGSGATLQTLISGERPIAALILDAYVVSAIARGANLYVVQPRAGVPASLQLIAIPAQAPQPDLGKAFVDFALSEAAQDNWQQKHGALSLRDDVTPIKPVRGRRTMKDIKLLRSTLADLEDSYHNQAKLVEEWGNLFK